MDPIHIAAKWLDHNRYVALGVGIAAGCMVYLGACASTVKTPDGSVVDRAGLGRWAIDSEATFAKRKASLDAEIAAYNADIEGYNQTVASLQLELDEKDAIRESLVNVAGGIVTSIASGGGVNPIGLATTGVTLLGLLGGGGALLDNRRKDKVLKTVKTSNTGE